MHSLIVGITKSGKSTLARSLALDYLSRDIGVLVLDPNNDNWPCSFKTTDPIKFLAVAKKSKRCALFIDEAGEMVGKGKSATGMIWITSRARHWGHCTYLIAQRAQMVELNVRAQCSTAYVFKQSATDAKLLSDQFADEALLGATALQQYEFLYSRSCVGTQRMKLSL